ncbi:ovarian-specific serine/threonine-protein kinase Lok-like [Oppia nitens]|uniref:ovarian-specific serine/threonine-protein kinase Lok-like n=1 Tax=Oppia nitens TaxID=1686743 RepID=UPI0023DA4230|nr:ovarian-specific serine/threonine-protein kinase Lok-like [Oppia nitens]
MDQTTQFPYVRHLHFMELCTDSLRSIIKRKTLNEFHAKQWFRQVSMGLQYLHHMGIAHMDIKTANILFIYDSSTGTTTYKLSDYGLSVTSNQIDYFVGTHAFAAPELARASMGAPVDTFRCDIYSLGLTICETLAGKNQHRYAMIAIKKVTIPNQLGQLTNKNASPRLTISTYPFVHMINWMLDDNPIHRPTIDELINCQWFQT